MVGVLTLAEVDVDTLLDTLVVFDVDVLVDALELSEVDAEELVLALEYVE